jgi:hypothetical protein
MALQRSVQRTKLVQGIGLVLVDPSTGHGRHSLCRVLRKSRSPSRTATARAANVAQRSQILLGSIWIKPMHPSQAIQRLSAERSTMWLR